MSSVDAIPEGFISLECKLPIYGGWYDLLVTVFREGKMCREVACGYYNAERECFEPVPGIVYATHYREIMPDEADMEEFRKREEMGVVWI